MVLFDVDPQIYKIPHLLCSHVLLYETSQATEHVPFIHKMYRCYQSILEKMLLLKSK